MIRNFAMGVLSVLLIFCHVACESPGKTGSASDSPPSGSARAGESGAAGGSSGGSSASRNTTASEPLTENPTTRAGRGAPDLASLHNHAAWIYIDGEEGRYIEKDGTPQIQWVVNTPVRRSPTFRVEVYEELLGSPKEFLCALQTQESFDGTQVVYAIRANEGAFQSGHEYSLLDPGESFTILDKTTNEQIKKIPLLSPGVYGIVAKIRNDEMDAEGLAVTYFTVAEATPADEGDASTTDEPTGEQ